MSDGRQHDGFCDHCPMHAAMEAAGERQADDIAALTELIKGNGKPGFSQIRDEVLEMKPTVEKLWANYNFQRGMWFILAGMQAIGLVVLAWALSHAAIKISAL